jgi:acetyltransferase-like isoleucine patch superfamily enzyme
MLKSPVQKRLRYQPWLWPGWFLFKFTRPIPAGLWMMNFFCQRILGINAEIPWMVHFTSNVKGKISIGKNVHQSFALSGGCYIQGINGIEIGDDTIFAPGVKIISANHRRGNLEKSEPCEPIRIGKRCWIAANAVILPGVQMGDDVIVGAGAVVTRSFPENVVVAGVPAQIIKSSQEDEIVR